MSIDTVDSPYLDYTSGTVESNDSLYPITVAHEGLTDFVPLPSNPAELTTEQVCLLFAGNVSAGLRQLARLALESGSDAA